MSYEGYEQMICKNGHYRTHDCYSIPDSCSCGAGWAWQNSVDDTNGYEWGFVDPDTFVVLKDAVTKQCPTCLHEVLEEILYEAPQDPIRLYHEENETDWKRCDECVL